MIYLLRSYTKTGSLLKLGYANSLSNRLSQYKSHNPGIELLDSREGDLDLELKFHLYLHSLGHLELMKEWYKDEEDILNIFKLPEEGLDKLLWENRDNVFPIKTRCDTVHNPSSFEIYKKLVPEEFTDNIELLFSSGLKIDEVYYSILFEERKEELLCNVLKEIIENSDKELVRNFFSDLNNVSFFEDKMKIICDYKRDYPQLFTQYKSIMSVIIPSKIENYINLVGYEKCSACDYQEKNIQDYIKTLGQPEKEEVYKNFEVGKRYSYANIKQILSSIYSSLSLTKTPKAVDLENYFDLKTCLITNKETGKKDHGYLILKQKEL